MSDALILSHTHHAVLTLTLNRPKALNSFTTAMHVELLAALNQAASDASVRCVVLTGAGRGFCAGQDLADPAAAPNLDGGPATDLGALIDRYYRPLVQRLRNMPVPVVAAVNGVAAGAGASLAMTCDIAIAAPTASFIQAFSKIGLIPDAGGSWFLVERLGLARAMALAMTGDKLGAEQAQQWGLVWQVEADCLAAAWAMAERLAAMPTQALVATRALLRDASQRTLSAHLDVERDTQSQLGRTHDYIEGVSAFLQKRPAQFTGN